MTKEELEKAIREIYDLWYINDSDNDIDFILNQVINKIGKED